MADGDIALRNPGANPGDIALSGGGGASAGVAIATWTAFDATAGPSIPAQIYSVQAEVIYTPEAETAKVYSVRPEAVYVLDAEPGKVYSVAVEAVYTLEDEPARVFSVQSEIIYGRPLDPYGPYVSGGSSSGLCVSFASSVAFEGDESCCDGFSSPACGSGEELVPEQLAFEKATADTVLLCTRGLSGLFPTGALSVMSWARLTAFSGAGVQVPIAGGLDAVDGWRLAYGGSAAPSEVLLQYRDTAAALRSDSRAFSGGTLVGAGWHALGGSRAGTDPWAQRAWVDDEAGAATNGTVAPQAGTNDAITLFGESGGAYFTGMLLFPVFFTADLGADGQAAFFDDLGQHFSTEIFRNPALVLSPRADSSVAAGDPVRVWMVDRNNDEVSGPVAWGTPAYYKGPWWGLSFSDIHWVQVPWRDADLTAGKTVILSVQGASVPGANQHVASRMAAGAGGFSLEILTTDGTDATLTLYDSTGAQALQLTLDVTVTLGSLVYYVVQIGVDGTGLCTFAVYRPEVGLVNATTGTPSTAVALDQDQRWGRGTSTGSAYTAGTCFLWAEFDGLLSSGEIVDYIAQEEDAPVPKQELAGCDGNVWDDGDPVRLWGPYDATGTYGSEIVFTGIGSTQITVGG